MEWHFINMIGSAVDGIDRYGKSVEVADVYRHKDVSCRACYWHIVNRLHKDTTMGQSASVCTLKSG
jgi:hypothetical protein